MTMRGLTLKLTMAAAAVLLVSACTTTKPADTSGTGTTTTQPAGPAAGSAADFVQNVGDRVFFDYDRYDLDAEDRAALDRQAAWLKTHGQVTVTIEGHADERGTREYNLALGARRANTVRDYLVANGIEASRLSTISYGKERPVCVESAESCWSTNRRGVTVITFTPVS